MVLCFRNVYLDLPKLFAQFWTPVLSRHGEENLTSRKNHLVHLWPTSFIRANYVQPPQQNFSRTPMLNCQRNSGFQSPGFHISQSKFLRFRNPIYLTWGYIHCFATTYSFTIITINLEILERSLLGSYFLKLYLDWKHGKIKFLRFLNKFVKTSAFVSWPIATS